MINDKRIEELKETINEQREQLKRQAQALMDKDAQIKKLEAEIGIFARNQMILLDHMTQGGEI